MRQPSDTTKGFVQGMLSALGPVAMLFLWMLVIYDPGTAREHLFSAQGVHHAARSAAGTALNQHP